MALPRFTPWTPEEDKLLVEAVAACGSRIIWKTVAKAVPGRDNKACRKRWVHSIDPKLRKGRWTASEDAVLLEAVNKHGKRWFEVAKDLPGRTDDQCAKRYREALDPSIRRDPWTKEEDEQLWEAFQRFGNKWYAISSTLNGRPAVHCRSRTQTLQRRRATEHPAANNVENEMTPQTDESPVDPPLLNIPTPSEMTPSPQTPPSGLGEPTQSPSAPFRLSSTVPSEPWTASVDGAYHASQNIPFPDASHMSGLVEGDPVMFDFVADQIQTDFWGGPLSQQNWTPTQPTRLVQDPTSSSIQGDPGQTVYGNNLLPCLGISGPLNVVRTASDVMAGAAFTMTCPVPHCYFQCQTVLDMWKHITWTHVRPGSKESGIEGIVERVVLGGLS